MQYKLNKNTDGVVESVSTTTDFGMYMSIPFHPENTDYQQFKKDLANGVACEDATGTAMTAQQITTFLETLK
jgi:hypothetical protein